MNEETMDTAALVERLRDETLPVNAGDMCDEAADALEALTVERDELRTALQNVMQIVDDDHYADGMDYPGHHHCLPGRWDNDPANRAAGKAGKQCEECATWNAARAALQRTAVNQAGAVSPDSAGFL